MASTEDAGKDTCTTPGCEQQIAWARTTAGKPMPVDRGSAGKPGGTLAVWEERGQLRCRVLRSARGDEPAEEPGPNEWRGTSHWATCIRTEDHRALAGWHFSPRRHRWEWRPTDRAPVAHWLHELYVRDEPREVVQAHAAELTGGEALPDEAWELVEQQARQAAL